MQPVIVRGGEGGGGKAVICMDKGPASYPGGSINQ